MSSVTRFTTRADAQAVAVTLAAQLADHRKVCTCLGRGPVAANVACEDAWRIITDLAAAKAAAADLAGPADDGQGGLF